MKRCESTGASAAVLRDAEWTRRDAEVRAAVAKLRRMIDREMARPMLVAHNDNLPTRRRVSRP